MKRTFHRIYTSDGLELHGLLYEPDKPTKSVLVHVHGMAGNFYKNKFVDFIAKELTSNDIAFCVFSNRGCEHIKDTYKYEEGKKPKIVRIGNTYEKFEESLLDIKTFIDFVSDKGFSNIHLSGHSLGSPKVVYYVTEKNDQRIKSLLLISPADMLGLVRDEPDMFSKQIAEAQKLIQNDKEDQILSDLLWGNNPISANTYINLFSDNAKDAIFNFYNPNDKLETLNKISIPTYAVMGRKDDALTISIEKTYSRLEDALVNSPKVKTEILGDATHGYRDYEQKLATAIMTWLTEVNT